MTKRINAIGVLSTSICLLIFPSEVENRHELANSIYFFFLHCIAQSNPPPKSRSYSMASQGSGSSPMSMRRPSQNPATLFGWSQVHKGSSLYSSKRSLLPDHLLDAREVQRATDILLAGARILLN